MLLWFILFLNSINILMINLELSKIKKEMENK